MVDSSWTGKTLNLIGKLVLFLLEPFHPQWISLHRCHELPSLRVRLLTYVDENVDDVGLSIVDG